LRDIERNEAKVVCGYQDAYMIVHGGLQLMDFVGKHPIQPGPPATLRSLTAPLPFLLITTGVERLSGSVHGPMAERWMQGDREVIDAMLRIADLTEEGADALIARDYAALARAMNENHRLVAALGGSGDAIDKLIGHCREHGALGAKLAGAGLGGTVIALTEDADALQAALRNEGYSRFMRPTVGPGVLLEPAPGTSLPENQNSKPRNSKDPQAPRR
jgi:galactokinase/mevalonate kinase-like predicted kinase